MQIASETQYSFDLWADMAKNNPERFEQMRIEAIEEIIQSTSGEQQMQLRRLQWRIDRLRERSGTPLAATIAISKMMWESFNSLKDQFESIVETGTSSRTAQANSGQANKVQRTAEIVPFKLRRAVEVD